VSEKTIKKRLITKWTS